MWYHSIPCFSFLSLIPFFLSPVPVFFRLCWVWRWDQAGPVSPRPGETVACELFQMSDLQHGPNRRVHQQVSGHQTPKLLPASPPLEAKYVSDILHSFGLFSVAGMEFRTVRQITMPSLGWNARPAADTSVEGFWRWDQSSASGLVNTLAGQFSSALQESTSSVEFDGLM